MENGYHLYDFKGEQLREEPVEKFKQWRVTLLPAVLEAARNTLMLVAGDDKAQPLQAVLHDPYETKKYPSQIATYNGKGVIWFLDKAAARLAGQERHPG